MLDISREKFQIVGFELSEADAIARPAIGFWKDAWRRLKKNKIAMLSLFALAIFIVLSVIGPLLTPYAYDTQNYSILNQLPNGDHWFGTDALGRDLFARVWRGGRVSLLIGFITAGVEVVIGGLYGGISGYFSGRVDIIMMRIAEVLNGIPFILVVILLLIIMPKGIVTMIVALIITGWEASARLVRAQVLQLREYEFVLAARALGASPTRLIVKHLIPNTIGVLIVYTSFDIPAYIFTEAFLSFIGMGIQPPDTSWGALIAEGQGVMTLHPHLLLFPAGALCLTVLAFNLLGDGLRDALDPRLRQ